MWVKLARVATNDYRPQFPLRLMNKDFPVDSEGGGTQQHLPMPVTDGGVFA